MKQKAAINRRKPGYNGFFGTPEGIRTPDTRLRRAVLCPAELLAHMQFLFISVTPAVENPPDVRSLAFLLVRYTHHNFPLLLIRYDIVWLLVNLHKIS